MQNQFEQDDLFWLMGDCTLANSNDQVSFDQEDWDPSWDSAIQEIEDNAWYNPL